MKSEFLVNSFENVTKHLLFGNVKPYVVFPKLNDNWWNITTFQIKVSYAFCTRENLSMTGTSNGGTRSGAKASSRLSNRWRLLQAAVL